MFKHIRLELEMTDRALDVDRAHPDGSNPGHAAAAARAAELRARAGTLSEQELNGRRAVSAAVANREGLKAGIAELLRMLAGIAKAASKEEPDLSVSVLRPNTGGSSLAFITRARSAQTAAVAHRELLEKYGLSATFVDDLAALLDQYDVALNEKNAGRAAHIGARAELKAVVTELVSVVRQLDAINRYRFRNQPELLAAWKSACSLRRPVGGKVAMAPVVKEGEAA